MIQLLTLMERLRLQILLIVKDELEAMDVRTITNVQAVLLMKINGRPQSMGQIAAGSGHDAHRVAYHVRRLTAAGYVASDRSVYDRRKALIVITMTGQRLSHNLESRLKQRISGNSQPVLDHARLLIAELSQLV